MIPSLRIIEPALAEVRERLTGMARAESEFVSGLAGYALAPRGQMLRPSVLLATSLLGGSPAPPPAATTLALAVELIHEASLLHDDVVDESRVRRRIATVNSRWGNKEAILLGDFLLARSMECICQVADPRALGAVERITRNLAVGQLAELSHAGDVDLDEATYLDIVAHKTARFFSECAYLGGWTAGLDNGVTTLLSTFGLGMGMTYQILDDVLDVTGSPGGLGKETGHDAVNQTITLPIIRCLALAGEIDRALLRQALASRDGEFLRGNLKRLVIESGAQAECMARAQGHAREAVAQLDALPQQCSRPIRQALSEMIEHVFATVRAGGDPDRATAPPLFDRCPPA